MSRAVILVLLLLLAFAPLPGFSQEAEPAAPAEVAEEAAAPATTQTSVTFPDHTVIEAFEALLRAHPASVGTILSLDPNLINNAQFLAGHPELAAFVADHPELSRNPRIYMDAASVPHVNMYRSGPIDQFLEGLMIITVMLLLIFTGVWLIRTVIEQRRWSRLARTQTEVHGKLLDRFTSNEELINYIQSSAGRRFLESAPIPVESEAHAVAPPIARMFLSLQIGIIIAAGAIGMLMVSGRFEADSGLSLFALGTVGLCVGIGFAIAGVVSFVLSKRMGLWTAAPDRAAE